MAIFTRLGLNFRAVAADNSSIGGSGSHEFHVIAETGEDDIVYNPNSDYAANIRSRRSSLPAGQACSSDANAGQNRHAESGQMRDVAKFLNVPLSTTIKSLVLAQDVEDDAGRSNHRDFGAVARRSWIKRNQGGQSFGRNPLCHRGRNHGAFSTKPGYIGPVAPTLPVRVVVDRTGGEYGGFRCSANDEGFHHVGVNWGAICRSRMWWRICAMWWRATLRRMAMALWPFVAALRSVMYSNSARNIPKP